LEALRELEGLDPSSLPPFPELRKTVVVSGAKEAASLFPDAAVLQEEE
jgi:hypothetical protein